MSVVLAKCLQILGYRRIHCSYKGRQCSCISYIYNRNYFEEYLLKNTKYETASTSRHDFGEVYSENGEDFIKLNLQVRFR